MTLALPYPPNTAWTADQDQYLMDHYRTDPHADIAAVLGRSRSSVRNRCWRLGLQKKVPKHDAATVDRICAFYEAHAGKAMDLAGFATELGLRRSTIAKIAGTLGLTDTRRPPTEAAAKSAGAKHAFYWRMGLHPRGMLGKRHTPEARRQMSETRTAAYAEMTPVQRGARVLAALKVKAGKGKLVNPRPNATWKQAWHTIGGKRHFFRSKWEVNYAHYLEWLKARGEIAEWEYEPTTFWFEKIKRGVRSYTPDFRVTELDGRQAYHEVKGWMDDRSATKLKRMAKYHPSVQVVLVDSGSYRKLNRQVLGLVPGWS
jgi:hypothetical protein